MPTEQPKLAPLFERINNETSSIANRYWTQLLNHDGPLSVPQIEETLSDKLYEVEFIQMKLNNPQGKKDSPENSLQWVVTPIHPSVASRTYFYREKAEQSISHFFSSNNRFPIDFTNTHPAPPGAESHSGYPQEGISKNPKNRCTTGGFFSSAQRPDLTGFVKTASLLSDFSQWIDKECRSPRQVSLYLDGQKKEFRCHPGKTKDPNLDGVFANMDMCDPLIYGFIPVQHKEKNTPTPHCLLPNPSESFNIGRSFNYSENLIGRKPNSDTFNSYCDLRSKIYTQHFLGDQPLPEGIDDPSILLAAQLAMENRALFQQKKDRMHQTCNLAPSEFIESGHCESIKQRVERIEKAIQRLESLPLHSNDPEQWSGQ